MWVHFKFFSHAKMKVLSFKYLQIANFVISLSLSLSLFLLFLSNLSSSDMEPITPLDCNHFHLDEQHL